MEVSALDTPLSGCRGNLGRLSIGYVTDGEDHLVDLVPRALVVEEVTGTEFADCQEPRPLEILIVTLGRSAPRYPGRKRQSREAVAGQKAFTREITVAVE